MEINEKSKRSSAEVKMPTLIAEWKDYFNTSFDIFSRNNGIMDKNQAAQLAPPIEIKIDNAHDFSFKEEAELQKGLDKVETEKEMKTFDLNSIEVKDSELEKDPSALKLSKEFKEPVHDVNEISFANNRFSFEDIKPHLSEVKKLNFSLSNISMSNSLTNLNNLNEQKSIDIDKSGEIKEQNINDSLVANKILADKNEFDSFEINSKIELDSNDVINDVFENKYLTKNKDKEIKNLVDKLNAYKYQNKIMLEENNKLLEIINLFKILQNMEKENVNEQSKILEKEKEISKIQELQEIDQTQSVNKIIDPVNSYKIETQNEKIQLGDSKKESKTNDESNKDYNQIDESNLVKILEIEKNFIHSRKNSSSANLFNDKKEIDKELKNKIVGAESVHIKANPDFKRTNSTSNKNSLYKDNRIDHIHDICNIASVSPRKEEVQANNSIPLNEKMDNLNNNYLSFKDLPIPEISNQSQTEPNQNNNFTKPKTFIDTKKTQTKKSSYGYGRLHQTKFKNEKDMNINKQPVQVSSSNNQTTKTTKSYIKISNSQSNYHSHNSLNKETTSNLHLKQGNNNLTNTFKSTKTQDKNTSEYFNNDNSLMNNTENNNPFIKSLSNNSLYENQRNIDSESRHKYNRYDININNYFEEDNKDNSYDREDNNTSTLSRNITVDSNASHTRGFYRHELKREYIDNNLTSTSVHVNKDIDDASDKYSYNKIIKMLEKYREMNEKLITNLSDKHFLSQPVVIDIEKRKKGVDNLKEILEYINVTKTIEEKRDQMIPFYLIDKRKLYENIVNYIFYNKESSGVVSPISKNSSFSNLNTRRVSNLKI